MLIQKKKKRSGNYISWLYLGPVSLIDFFDFLLKKSIESQKFFLTKKVLGAQKHNKINNLTFVKLLEEKKATRIALLTWCTVNGCPLENSSSLNI